MNKELLELLDKINAKKAEVKNLAAEDKIEEATKAKEEMKGLQAKFNLLKDIVDTQPDVPVNAVAVEPVVEPTEANAVTKFAQAAKSGFKNTMTEGTKADGGYTVPEDILTQINTYREAKASLQDLVDVETVTTNKGSRTFKKRAQQTGFTQVGEGAAIGAGTTPQFEVLNYDIKKYAGYFPVTNELLEDSDANITETLVAWIGDESRVTRNKLILTALDSQTKTAISGLDDIKKALNVTLGQAFKATSKIVTNDDGLQYLDTLKDSEGRYILQPQPGDPMKMVICAGATTVPVVVVPNADMPTASGKIPMIIGDLFEAVKMFDRKQLTIMTSDTASAGSVSAFENDLTIFRAIEREDVEIKDLSAVVYGQVTAGE